MSMFGQPMGQPRQLILESAAGIAGNGIATISGDNSFSLVAHLPQPSVISSAPSVYAAYLVDEKGSSGFCAGTLSSAGSGMYQLRFRSQVPLVHYDKVIVSLENPQVVRHYPQGPILLQVKPGLLAGMGMGGLAFLEPLKKAGGTVFGKAAGFVKGRAGGIFGRKQEKNQVENQMQIQEETQVQQIQPQQQQPPQQPQHQYQQQAIPQQDFRQLQRYQVQNQQAQRFPRQDYQQTRYNPQNNPQNNAQNYPYPNYPLPTPGQYQNTQIPGNPPE